MICMITMVSPLETEERTMSVQVNESQEISFRDVQYVGPGTLAGDYLRLFWQPIYHSPELVTGRAVPIRILCEDFTLYRGESGKPFVVGSRCAHRGMPLHPGWVEGDEIRCFYHGWKYDGEGRCTEQPAEPKPFCERVNIAGYPTREYLGLVFVYLGPGEPPEFPVYPNVRWRSVGSTRSIPTRVRATSSTTWKTPATRRMSPGLTARLKSSTMNGMIFQKFLENALNGVPAL